MWLIIKITFSEQMSVLSKNGTTLEAKAWFPLNVSVLATDRSCLLARTSLRCPGFHRQASQGLLRGLSHQRYVNRAAHSVFNHK